MTNLIAIIAFSFLSTTSFYARVVRVIDGDTIVVLTESKEQIKIRLEGLIVLNRIRISEAGQNRPHPIYASEKR
jgi:hypothetical protein